VKTTQVVLKDRDLNSKPLTGMNSTNPQLGILFGSVACFENSDFQRRLKEATPDTQWIGCSTAGEVSQQGVTDGTAVLTTFYFENPKSEFKIALGKIQNAEDSYAAGKKLAAQLKRPDLKSVILISPGVNVNGSMLVKGVSEELGPAITITGGLAGDEGKFLKTYTLSKEGVTTDAVIGLGLYGESIVHQHGCMGGWDPFGKVRKVTRSESNVLFELDGKPALDIYKEYLGPHAKELPASGLMFPFAMLSDDQANTGLIRTILGVDDKTGSLTMAGNIEQGSLVRLMHANTEGLVSGARTAAQHAVAKGTGSNSFAMVVSCVGRKLVMGTNVDEEVEAVSEIFGANCVVGGFYSYGEVSPMLEGVGCELHNQTMTISFIYEKE
jgi:hypothetical protein